MQIIMENQMNQLFYVSSARNNLNYEDILHIVEKAREHISAAKEIDNHLILRMLQRFKNQGSLR